MIRRTALNDNDAAFLQAWRLELVSRRTFLARMAGVSVAALFPLTAAGGATQGSETSQEVILTAPQREVLDAVQVHLFPPEPGSPGAREINALAYLEGVLRDAEIDREERQFIRNGVGWLEDLLKDSPEKTFSGLNATQREKMLRKIEQSRAGENWLATLLLYLFEALLCDPVYGGNPNGIGWQWLEHQPGFPRPPADRIYGKL